MSYNTKYILKYCNAKGNKLRIELQLWDYVGTQFLLVNDSYVLDDEDRMVIVNKDGNYIYDRDTNGVEGTANPFLLTFHNDTGEKGGAIRALEANMEFYEDAMFNIDDLATSDETEIRAIFYYDDNVEFIGFVTPDFFNVEITENPIIKLTASDRIGVLKDVPYTVMGDVMERRRIIDILVNCLKETGLLLPLNIACSMYCDQFEEYSGDADFQSYEYNNPFYDTFVNEYRFVTDFDTLETIDCYKVIQSLMNQFNCLLTQINGEWWIVNKYDLDKGNGIVFKYTETGAHMYARRIDFNEINFNLVDVGGERTLVPVGAKNTYKLDNGKDMIYPLNHSLLSDDASLWSLKYWTRRAAVPLSHMSRVIPAIYYDDGSVKEWYMNEVRELAITDFNVTTLANDTVNFTPYPYTVKGNSWILESEKFDVVTLDRLKSSFKLSISAVGKPYTAVSIGLFMEIEKTSQPGVKHYFSLRDLPDVRSFTGDIVFWQISDINTSGDIEVLTRGFENKYNSNITAVEQTFEVEVNIAKGQRQDFDINTAKFFVRIYPNRAYKKNDYNSDLFIVENVIKSIRVEFLNDNQNPNGTVFQSKILGKFTKPTETREVMFGDYQEVGQNGYFYKYRDDSLSIFYNRFGDRLKDWYTPYDTERNPQLIHALRQLTYSYGKAHDELRIGFDIARVDPLAHYAVRCISDKKVLVNPEDDNLTDTHSKYITAGIGKYLNNKRFVLVEGTIDYLRSHFEGILAQIRTDEIQHEEYIYSYFEQGDIN